MKFTEIWRETSLSFNCTPAQPWQVLVMGVTVWLARWSRQTAEEQDRKRYVVTLTVLAAGAVLVSLFRAILTFSSLVRVRNHALRFFLRFFFGVSDVVLSRLSVVAATNRC